jgi:beta-glucosidase
VDGELMVFQAPRRVFSQLYRRSVRALVVAVLAAGWCALTAALAPSARAEGRCGEHPWCNTSLSPTRRADLLLAAMSEWDKIGVLTGQGASDVGMPAITWTDGALGAGGIGSGGSDATAMPAGVALAANFSQSMAYRYGAVVGTEVRHRGFDGDYGPTVNIMRTPLGGRTYEAYGEDPFLAAQTAVGWIDGLQAQGVMADVKHFAENNQEGQLGVSPLFGVYGGRTITNVIVDPRTMHEIELVPFEAAVAQAHAATVMCSYNLVNGKYACANPTLLTSILRDQWGFDGFVVSDAGACHETAPDMQAGLNFDIADTCYSPPEVEADLAAGAISQSLLNDRVFETLRELFAFGFFDHSTWSKDTALDDVRGDEAVADRVEEGGAVLLKNDGVLPINPSRVHSIAVIGSAADQYIHGNGSSQVTPYVQSTALEGIEARAAQSHISVTYNDGLTASGAQAAAKNADLAIVVVADSESEGDDKVCMSLIPQCTGGQATPPDPEDSQLAFGDQDQMVQEVARANPRTVVVMETGAPVLTPWRGKIGGLLEAWYPGEDGGTAIARLLFGDVDPSGRLPVTFPKQASDVPTAHGGAAEYPGVITPLDQCTIYTETGPCPYYQETYSEGVMIGYRWYQDQHIQPAYPFGFGLSYTSFRFSGLTLSHVRRSERYVAHVTVTNSGSRTGSAVPELYVSLPSAPGVPEPPWQLKGFAKVTLAPGHSERLSIPLDARSFSYWSDSADGWRIARGCDVVGVGSSSASLRLRAVIAQEGAHCAAFGSRGS